jgi:hypothetical protein
MARKSPATPTRVVLGISTFGRDAYLRDAIQSFTQTRSRDLDWTVVVSDDGSGHWDSGVGRILEDAGVPYLALRHGGWRIAALTNSTLDVGFSLGADVVFCANDDIIFTGAGWDTEYVNAIAKSGVEHLVHFDPKWGEPTHDMHKDLLRSMTTGARAQGAFFTVTRKVFSEVGYLDEVNFWGRGFAHVDYTHRCCLAGFNDHEKLWDAAGGSELIRLQPRERYVQSADWDDPQVKLPVSNFQRQRRQAVIDAREHAHLGFANARLLRSPPVILQAAGLKSASLERLESAGLADAPRHFALHGFDARVLNLRSDVRKWAMASSQLADVGIVPERASGLDGSDGAFDEEWGEYVNNGLVTPLDRALGRKAISSRGALAYLGGVGTVIRSALHRRARGVLLFDDDVMVSSDFDAGLVAALRELPDAWNILYLGWTPRGPHPARAFRGSLSHSDGKCNGSFAVAISERIFDELLAGISAKEEPFDEILRRVDLEHPDRGFIISPPLVMPIVTTSAIRSARSQIKFAAEGQWEWSHFVGAIEHAFDPSDSAEGLIETLAVVVPEFDQSVFRLATWLSCDPCPSTRIVWICAEIDGSARLARSVARLDPRFSALVFDIAQPMPTTLASFERHSSDTIRFIDSTTALDVLKESGLRSPIRSLFDHALEGRPGAGLSTGGVLKSLICREPQPEPVVERLDIDLACRTVGNSPGSVMFWGENGLETLHDH